LVPDLKEAAVSRKVILVIALALAAFLVPSAQALYVSPCKKTNEVCVQVKHTPPDKPGEYNLLITVINKTTRPTGHMIVWLTETAVQPIWVSIPHTMFDKNNTQVEFSGLNAKKSTSFRVKYPRQLATDCVVPTVFLHHHTELGTLYCPGITVGG
jgi:hypothetical protein